MCDFHKKNSRICNKYADAGERVESSGLDPLTPTALNRRFFCYNIYTMSWAGRRRILYGSGVVLFFILVIGIPTFLFMYEKPTCFDGVQNQDELGVDIGGPCALLHSSQVQNIAILWSRSFEVVPGLYNAVAQIDNPNFSAGAIDVPYSIKLFDSNSILISERKGRTYISPN